MSEEKNDREGDGSEEVVFRASKDNLIPTLLHLIREEYVKCRRSGISDDPDTVKKQMADEYAIEDAIFTWMDEMKEEKAKKDMMEKIRRRFDQRWNSW